MKRKYKICALTTISKTMDWFIVDSMRNLSKNGYDVTLISMIAPTSKDRVEMIAKEAKGFIYLVSSMGVTGTRDNTSFANNLEEIIEHIRQVTNTPVAIGFGINKPEQVKEFKQYADGVIVGSAIVNIIKEHGSQADEPLKEYIQSLTNEL